jgi:hypothetical protein
MNGNQSGAAPVFAARAWVNFDGDGGAAIRASGNVASVARNGDGDYTVTFSVAMPDANYAVIATRSQDGASTRTESVKVVETNANYVRLQANGVNDNSGAADASIMSVVVFM